MIPAPRRFLPLLLVCALLSTPLFAQPAADTVFIDRVDVNLVNVEVFVTDRDGRRVVDLTADDFEIYEDGRPVEVTNFYSAVRQSQVERGFEADRALVRGEAPPTAVRPLPEDQKLNLLVYVDNFNLKPQTRNRVLNEMEGFLEERLTQGDRVMIVAYNNRVDTVVPFTDSYDDIQKGLKQVRKMAGYRSLAEANRRDVIRDINFYVRSSSDPNDTYRQALDAVQAYAQAANEELERSAVGLRSVTRSLAGLPGRKAMLYVADGLSELPGQDLYEHLVQSYSRGTFVGGVGIDRPIDLLDFYRPEIFQEIVADANANQVTVYTLNAQGHFGDGLLSAEVDTVGSRGGGNSEIESIRNANLQAPMVNLAELTGGTAIRNTINFDGALARMGQDFDVFYSLGYRSPRGGDSQFHRIEVKVRRPDLEVRHRSGYVDKPQVERVADRTLSSLLLDLEKNPLGVGVDFGQPERQSRKKYVLPVIIRIPLKELALLPQGDKGQGKVTIFVGVRDDEGGISDIFRLPLPLELPKDRVESRSGEIAYRTNLEISRGTPTVAVAVWDELSGTESFVHKKVSLGRDRGGRRGP